MRIVVLAGGLSPERDVSISTGVMVCDALRKKGHKAVLLDVFFGYRQNYQNIFDIEYDFDTEASGIKEQAPDIAEIKKRRGGDEEIGENVIEICRMADIVFMALHGGDGENGKLQATFDVLGIKYTGTGYLGSALALNKGLTKQLLMANGVKTPSSRFFSIKDKADGKLEVGVEYPCVVKPCSGGSSIGVSIANNRAEYLHAADIAFKYEKSILVEDYIKGREFSVGVLGGKSLPIIEIKPKSGFFDYANKYQQGRVEEICPAELNGKLTEQMQEAAVKVFELLQLETYARIDFILSEDNEIYCLEANNLPGMTPSSLFPKEAAAVGLSYGDLCEQLIEESFLRYKEAGQHEIVSTHSGGHVQYSIEDLKGEKNIHMKKMTLKQIADACSGTLHGGSETECVTGVVINSKKAEAGFLFIAIKGSNADGHDFIPEAYANGAVCCIAEREPAAAGAGSDAAGAYILVKSCAQALKDIAGYYKSLFNVVTIGITGSVGKTTTKEMVYSVLSQKYKVLKNQGNFNNEIGVPLTLFRLRDYHEVAIVEMGISGFGEMRNLSRIVRPDICVITNIGDSHLEFLGDRAGVLKAKSEIFEYMADDGKVYLNGGDEMLLSLKEKIKTVVYYGIGRENSVYAEHITNMGVKGIHCEIHGAGTSFDVTIPAFGQHMVTNALAASAVGLDMGLDAQAVRRGIESFMPVSNRTNVIDTGFVTIIDDCYNANPTSVKAALDTLSELGGCVGEQPVNRPTGSGRKICILGDMGELGEKSAELHKEIGKYAAESGIDAVICAGKMSKHISIGASEHAGKCSIHYYPSADKLIENLRALVSKGDIVLVKASRAMYFETVVAALKTHLVEM